MSNQKPWTLLQVGDKVVFPDSHFTVTSRIPGGYSGQWHNPSATTRLVYEGGVEPIWWTHKLRVEKVGETPWYTKLAVGDTFRNSTGTVFTVVAVREKEIEALWKGSITGMTERVTISLREDSWITKSTLATPLSIAALQPPVEPPWYSQLAKGDTFRHRSSEIDYTVVAVAMGEVEVTWKPSRGGSLQQSRFKLTDPFIQQQCFPLSAASLQPPVELPWYTRLAKGDTFEDAVGTIFEVTYVLDKGGRQTIWIVQQGALLPMTFYRCTTQDAEWFTNAIPVFVAAMTPAPIAPTPPWWHTAQAGDRFSHPLYGNLTVTRVQGGSPPSGIDAQRDGEPAHTGGLFFPVPSGTSDCALNQTTLISRAPQQPPTEKPWWDSLKKGDQVRNANGVVLTVESARLDSGEKEITVRWKDAIGDVSATYRAGYPVDLEIINSWTPILKEDPATPPTPYSPSLGDRCYVDGKAWEVVEGNRRLGSCGFWQLQMKRIRSASDKTCWHPVKSTAWCQENLIPSSHWSRNLKVGDCIKGDDGIGPITWTVQRVTECGEYELGNTIDPFTKTLCPIIDRRWFSKAKLLPKQAAASDGGRELDIDLRDDPLPTPLTYYPRHHVPTIPLDDLAVGEAVDVPAGRYSKAMISDIVATYGKRAAEAGEKERIFGLISTETTHTIWREM